VFGVEAKFWGVGRDENAPRRNALGDQSSGSQEAAFAYPQFVAYRAIDAKEAMWFYDRVTADHHVSTEVIVVVNRGMMANVVPAPYKHIVAN
jgi:hypothetical protein